MLEDHSGPYKTTQTAEQASFSNSVTPRTSQTIWSLYQDESSSSKSILGFGSSDQGKTPLQYQVPLHHGPTASFHSPAMYVLDFDPTNLWRSEICILGRWPRVLRAFMNCLEEQQRLPQGLPQITAPEILTEGATILKMGIELLELWTVDTFHIELNLHQSPKPLVCIVKQVHHLSIVSPKPPLLAFLTCSSATFPIIYGLHGCLRMMGVYNLEVTGLGRAMADISEEFSWAP